MEAWTRTRGLYRDRRDAGRKLAARLMTYANRPDVIVLGLPRGGIPVAFEVAQALRAPLDVYVVRKLGVPGQEELAMGAIATGGVRVMHASVVDALEVPEKTIDLVEQRERAELERREQAYREGRGPLELEGKIVIVVDDGLATGSTMVAAATALRAANPARIVIGVPVGAPDTCRFVGRYADEVECAAMPPALRAVGLWYENFTQTSDEEVRELLTEASSAPRSGPEASPPASLALVDEVRRDALLLVGGPEDYDPLLERIGDARFVLLGEATHGTHDFYAARSRITKRLIEERGFHAVAIEADWPDAYRVNRYVRGISDDDDATEALSQFQRFPTWMWRNADMLDFVGWLKAFNDAQRRSYGYGQGLPVGLYGLDLYSLYASIGAVLSYLDRVDPEAARRARERYACFENAGDQAEAYMQAVGLGVSPSCEREALDQLVELRQRAVEWARADGEALKEAIFELEQNARVVRDAEEYYRYLIEGRVSTWNLRDRHMAATLSELAAHLDERVGRSKIVVWEHNSHLGDARATAMGDSGEWNVGQLTREQYGADAVLVGFTTYEGTVTAASEWDGAAQRMRVRPALPGSYEALFHETRLSRFALLLDPDSERGRRFAEPRLERAIGVVYRPDTERVSHYFPARLSYQFDAVIHFDQTRAVEPLERRPIVKKGEPPETYPFAV